MSPNNQNLIGTKQVPSLKYKINLTGSEALSIGSSLSERGGDSVLGNELEITTILGCPVNCNYCPQDQLRQTKGKRKNKLDPKDFEKALNNLDIPCGISWTGYSEPCLSKDLPEMASRVRSLGRYQVISTTLNGSRDSIEWVSKNPIWSLIVLHLPDDKNNMKGLYTNDNYLSDIKTTIETYIKRGLTWPLRMMTFGDRFREDVWEIIKYYLDKDVLNYEENIKLSKEVSSRAEGIKEVEGMKIIKDELDQGNMKTSLGFTCNKRKLNQPVLIPDGSLNLCSFDYGFRGIHGNLFERKFSEIRKEWIESIAKDYSIGNLNPCTQCEHYVPIEKDPSIQRENTSTLIKRAMYLGYL